MKFSTSLLVGSSLLSTAEAVSGLFGATAPEFSAVNAKCPEDPRTTAYNPVNDKCEPLCTSNGKDVPNCDPNTGRMPEASGSVKTHAGIGSAALKDDCPALLKLVSEHGLFFWNWDTDPKLGCVGAEKKTLENLLQGRDATGKKTGPAKFFPMAWGDGALDKVKLSAKDGYDVVMGYNEADMHGSNGNGITGGSNGLSTCKKGQNPFNYNGWGPAGPICAMDPTSAGMFKALFAPSAEVRQVHLDTNEHRVKSFLILDALAMDWFKMTESFRAYYERERKLSKEDGEPTQIWAPVIANACGTAGKAGNFAKDFKPQIRDATCQLNNPMIFRSAEQYNWKMDGALGVPAGQPMHPGSIFCAPKNAITPGSPNHFPEFCTEDNQDYGYFICTPDTECYPNNPMWLEMFEGMSGKGADSIDDPFTRIDVLPYHQYPGGADGKDKADKVKKGYFHMLDTWGHKRNLLTGRPISFALTEFAYCGLPANKSKMTPEAYAHELNEGKVFLKEIIPWLLNEPRVSHFSWFSDPDFPSFDLGDEGHTKFGGGYNWDSALFKNGELTPFGLCYTALVNSEAAAVTEHCATTAQEA